MRSAVLAAALTIILIAGCAGKAEANVPPWPETAQYAEMLSPGQLDGATEAINALNAAQKQQVSKLLDEVAASESTAAGLTAGVEVLYAGLKDIKDPADDSSAAGPALSAAKLGGTVVVLGMIHRTGAAAAAGDNKLVDAKALMRALPDDSVLGDKFGGAIKAEARAALGPELYIEALKAIRAKDK